MRSPATVEPGHCDGPLATGSRFRLPPVSDGPTRHVTSRQKRYVRLLSDSRRPCCRLTETCSNGSVPTSIVVGCPVADREWVIAHWLDHIVRAASLARVEVEVVLIGPADDPTSSLAREHANALELPLLWFDSGESVDDCARQVSELGGDEHAWPDVRLRHLVRLRNQLLDLVRSKSPELFLSIDSDVLLHERALDLMVELLTHSRYAAVGGKVHLSPFNQDAPNYAQLTGGGRLHRVDSTNVLEVDAIMALKLMHPDAYAIDYAFDARGEDIGWSTACRQRGLRLAWDGRVTSQHLMRRR